MGSLLGKKAAKKILLLGLDNAGKTTILYKLTLDELVTTIPTVGLNIETIEYTDVKDRHIEFQAWDLGGQKKIRDLWAQYYQGTDAIIFVIDSNEPTRLTEVREELCSMLKHLLLDAKVPLLILANKQDLPQSINVNEITMALDLESLTDRRWMIQETCAMTGEGLYAGLRWLHQNTKRRRGKRLAGMKSRINTEKYNQL